MKVGTYSIPDLRLIPKIRDYIDTLYNTYQLDEIDNEEAMAKLCGHKTARSGSWISKLADMRLYGLVEGRGLKLTVLSEDLVSGTSEEKQNATNEAIMSVSLWKELYEKFGKELPRENFWVQIQRLTGLNNLEAQKVAETVMEAFLDDISHYKPEEPKKPQQNNRGSNINAYMSSTTLLSQADLVKGLIEHGAFKIAKDFIDFIENKSKTEEAETEEE